ncbi:MAG: DUF6883 domain-containing protein [Chthoniobacterales bacterium]
MSQLPHSTSLIVEEAKIVGYLLDLDHTDGGPKARFFLGRGFSPESWEGFADALKKHGATQTITSEALTRHGRKYVVECVIETPDGLNPCILTVWISSNEDPPRLITAHPNS